MTRQARSVLVLFVLFAAIGIILLSMPRLTAAAMPASIVGPSQRFVNGTTGVDGTGDCTNTAGNPICKTIEYALSQSIAGSATVSDTINISPGTYNLASTLVITKYIILQGTTSNGLDVKIDGHLFAGSGPVIHAEAPRLTVNNLTIQNGNAGPGLGGGILVSGTSSVTVRNSFIMTNTASAGGGIYANNSSSLFIIRSQFGGNSATGNGGAFFSSPGATTLITASAVISNSAANGGGIYGQGPLTVVNSTIGDNFPVSGNGGGLYTTGTTTTVSLNNATIFNNQVAGQGGGIFAASGTVTLQNTILAGNASVGGSPNCSGAVGSQGFNLIGNNTGCTFSATVNDLVGTGGSPKDPLLGPLLSHGSYTMYRMPASGSLAINAGNNVTGCTDGQGHLLTVDQRNAVRPQGGRCDIGSVEFGDAPSLSSISPTSAVAGTGGFSMTLNGANFAGSNPQVLWTVNGFTTTFTTASMISHTSTIIMLNVPANAIAFPGTAMVAVQNPSAPVPNISGALPFTILFNPSQKFLYLPIIFK